MKKTILTTTCAAFIGLASIATASAQFVTGANEGASNTTSVSSSASDPRMNSMNKMKKKKMMKKGMMNDGMSGGAMNDGAKASGGGMSGGGMSGGMDKGGMKGGMEKKM